MSEIEGVSQNCLASQVKSGLAEENRNTAVCELRLDCCAGCEIQRERWNRLYVDLGEAQLTTFAGLCVQTLHPQA